MVDYPIGGGTARQDGSWNVGQQGTWAVQTDNPPWTTIWGASAAPVASADASAAPVAVSDAPGASKKLVLDELIISAGAAISVTFTTETSGAVILGPLYLAANSTEHIRMKGKGMKLATANKKLMMQTSGAGTISVLAGYHTEA